MKIVLQRVKAAEVQIQRRCVSRIGRGVCLLVGVEKGDSEQDARYLAEKAAGLRIFPDEEGKMNLSLQDTWGEVLVVSQFTLAGSVQKGRRPSFDRAEIPERAEKLCDFFVRCMESLSPKVETGVFGAMMDVHLINDGPVTFILSSKKSSR